MVGCQPWAAEGRGRDRNLARPCCFLAVATAIGALDEVLHVEGQGKNALRGLDHATHKVRSGGVGNIFMFRN